MARSRPRWRRILANIGIVLLALATVGIVGYAGWKLVLQPPVVEALPPLPSPTKPRGSAPAKVTAVFLGDAYSQDSGSRDWPTLVAKQMGWKEINLAAAGTGYAVAPTKCADPPCPSMRRLLAKVVALKPNVVVISGGQADGTRDVTNAAQALLSGLADQLPNTRVYVVSPFTGDPKAVSWVENTAKTVKTIASNQGASFIDVGQPLLNQPGLVDKKFQPTRKGMIAIAQAVLPDLE